MPTCKRWDGSCTYSGPADTFKPCYDVYHDVRCPKCGTSRVDTSDINAEWKSRGEEYGYGDDNNLRMKNANQVSP